MKILQILYLEDQEKLEVIHINIWKVFKLIKKAIFWEEDDQGFYTGSTDGLVNYWRVDDNGPQKT